MSIKEKTKTKNFSGFSFSETDDGEIVGVAGEKVLPHRTELIKDLIAQGVDVSDMFFNFKTENCINPSNWEQIDAEQKLFESWQGNI